MKAHEKEDVISRYNQRLAKFGYSPKTLGWDKERHFLRYHILLSEWEYNGDTLLDFGCGFGDLYQYIVNNKLDIKYSGVDINDFLVLEGIRKHEGIKLSTCDFINNRGTETYDYIVSSGVHNLRLEDNWSFIEKTFRVFHQAATKAFALNFISDKCDQREDHIYYCNPEKILALAYGYSNRILLSNNYMPFEFTIFVNKQANFEKTKAVYDDFLKYC